MIFSRLKEKSVVKKKKTKKKTEKRMQSFVLLLSKYWVLE